MFSFDCTNWSDRSDRRTNEISLSQSIKTNDLIYNLSAQSIFSFFFGSLRRKGFIFYLIVWIWISLSFEIETNLLEIEWDYVSQELRLRKGNRWAKFNLTIFFFLRKRIWFRKPSLRSKFNLTLNIIIVFYYYYLSSKKKKMIQINRL